MSKVSSFGLFAPQNYSVQPPYVPVRSIDERWYVIFTVPKHEKSVFRHLDTRRIEVFLPTYEIVHLWRNRQRVKLAVPLFPCYLFVRTSRLDCGRVCQCPGLIRLIGNRREPLPVPDSAIELLRVSVAEKKIQPYHELIVGKRVRVKSGPMQGVEGVLIRKSNGFRFVLRIALINQDAAIEMDPENLELISGDSTETSSQSLCAQRN